jgi:hypothetical protein
MAFIYFDSVRAPVGFLIVRDDASPQRESDTRLIQSDFDFPGVASRMGWRPCECSPQQTDGTVDCPVCGRKVGAMIADALQFIRDREGEIFAALDEYFL